MLETCAVVYLGVFNIFGLLGCLTEAAIYKLGVDYLAVGAFQDATADRCECICTGANYGQHVCNAQCKNLNIDNSNCGTCGKTVSRPMPCLHAVIGLKFFSVHRLVCFALVVRVAVRSMFPSTMMPTVVPVDVW